MVEKSQQQQQRSEIRNEQILGFYIIFTKQNGIEFPMNANDKRDRQMLKMSIL